MTDPELLAAVEGCLLPMEQWNHRSHVRVAYIYASAGDLAVAIGHMRAAINRFNDSANTPDALDRGYHETMTQAFMTLVHAAILQTGPHESSEQFCQAHPELLNRRILRQYYSRERMMTWDAKGHFVTPDLKPLPVPGL